MTNPYERPRSRLADAAPAEPAYAPGVYLPWQAAACGLFGGPLAMMYVVRANELALGDSRRANLVLYVGIILVAILVPVVGRISDPLAIGAEHAVLTLLGAAWVHFRQMPRARAQAAEREPWPNLVIVVLASVGASALLAFLATFLLAATGLAR